MKDDNQLLSEDSLYDNTDIQASEVNEYLESLDTDELDYPPEEESDSDRYSQEDIEEQRITLPKTTMFDRDNDSVDSIKDSQKLLDMKKEEYITVTSEEKETYLVSMMMDSPFIIDIKLENGVTVTCKDTTQYETIVAEEAIRRLIQNRNVTPILTPFFARQSRIILNVLKINGIPVPNKFEVGNPSVSLFGEQFEKDVENLTQKLLTSANTNTVSKQALLIRALEVFYKKLILLEEAAFNKDFWKPVGQD